MFYLRFMLWVTQIVFVYALCFWQCFIYDISICLCLSCLLWTQNAIQHHIKLLHPINCDLKFWRKTCGISTLLIGDIYVHHESRCSNLSFLNQTVLTNFAVNSLKTFILLAFLGLFVIHICVYTVSLHVLFPVSLVIVSGQMEHLIVCNKMRAY